MDATEILVEKLEELRLEMWGYEHLFETEVHASAFYSLDDMLNEWKEATNDRT